jgi:hypothetical protein
MLFTPGQLGEYLRDDVDTAAAVLAERVASGWLRGVTKATAWPEPVPEDLFAWAIELGAIAYENPAGVSAITVGGETTQFAYARRAEILRAAAGSSYAVTTATAAVGAFPDLVAWPDPPRII